MANTFEELNKEELLAVAEMFAVDARPSMAKAAIIKELTEMGVDYPTYQALLVKDAELGTSEEIAALVEERLEPEPAPQVEVVAVAVTPTDPAVPVPVVTPTTSQVVLKMTRQNVRYDFGKYRFTREHPYVLVEADDADPILEQEGFRMATPKELREFYS